MVLVVEGKSVCNPFINDSVNLSILAFSGALVEYEQTHKIEQHKIVNIQLAGADQIELTMVARLGTVTVERLLRTM